MFLPCPVPTDMSSEGLAGHAETSAARRTTDQEPPPGERRAGSKQSRLVVALIHHPLETYAWSYRGVFLTEIRTLNQTVPS